MTPLMIVDVGILIAVFLVLQRSRRLAGTLEGVWLSLLAGTLFALTFLRAVIES